jgi:hypothetical protein
MSYAQTFKHKGTEATGQFLPLCSSVPPVVNTVCPPLVSRSLI